MVFTISKNAGITCEEKGCVWRQLFISFMATLPFFTHGVEATALSISAHSGHFNLWSTGDVWRATCMILGAGLSAPIYCYVIDRYGRRSGIYFVSLTQAASCIPLFLEPSTTKLIVLHVLAGISTGGLFTVFPIYIREISDTHLRGVTLSMMMVMTSAGYLTNMVMDEEGIMFLMVAVIAVQMLAMVVILETPIFLVMVGKVEKAKTSIAKLKCLDEGHPTVSKELMKLTDELNRVRVNGKLSFVGILRNTIYRDITKMGIVLYTVMVVCGSIAFLDQEKTLAELKVDWDREQVLIISCLFAGSLLTFCVIRIVDRKYLLTFGITVMVLSMGVLAIHTQSDSSRMTSFLVPVVSLGILILAYGFCWALPVIVMVECLNFEIRATVLGAIYTYSQAIKLAHVHSYQYIEDYTGLYVILYIFCGINILGGVYALFAIPDIKDKSMKQIERQMKRVPLIRFTKTPVQ